MKVGASAFHPLASFDGKLRPVETLETEVAEASDLMILPDGRLAAVSDEAPVIGVVDALGDISTVTLEAGKHGFEAMTYDPINRRYFMVDEDQSTMYRYDANFKLEKKIKLSIDGSDNKGCEGMTYLPAEASPTGEPALLLVKEGEPRGLYLLDVTGTGKPHKLKVDDAIKDVCKDFSGITYDPVSKHVLICSEESSTVAEVSFKGDKAKLISNHHLRDCDGNKLPRVEGIAADARGLYVLTENDGLIHRYER